MKKRKPPDYTMFYVNFFLLCCTTTTNGPYKGFNQLTIDILKTSLSLYNVA